MLPLTAQPKPPATMLPLNGQRYGEKKDEATWGDALRTYASQRSALPWGDGTTAAPPIERVSHFEVKRKQRAFDPIHGAYRSARREEAAAATEQAATRETLDRARARQLRYDAQPFDIVTNKPHADFEAVTGLPSKPAVDVPAELPTSHVHFNIVSNLPRPFHKPGPGHIEFDEAKQIQLGEEAAPPAPLEDPMLVPEAARPRDSNIVSNKYWKGDTARKAAEKQKQKEMCERRYAATHDYDILRGRYYEGGKEAAFLSQRKALEEVQGTSQMAREPTSYQIREGVAYDVVTNEVLDSGRLGSFEEIKNRRLATKCGTDAENAIRGRAEAYEFKTHSRMLERIGRTGVLREREEGRLAPHHIISNEKYVGRLARPRADSMLKKSSSVWSKLHGGEAEHGGGATATTARLDRLAGPGPGPGRAAAVSAAKPKLPRDLSGGPARSAVRPPLGAPSSARSTVGSTTARSRTGGGLTNRGGGGGALVPRLPIRSARETPRSVRSQIDRDVALGV